MPPEIPPDVHSFRPDVRQPSFPLKRHMNLSAVCAALATASGKAALVYPRLQLLGDSSLLDARSGGGWGRNKSFEVAITKGEPEQLLVQPRTEELSDKRTEIADELLIPEVQTCE